jgi:hypothetical protein
MNKHFNGVDIVDENDTTMNRSDVNSDRFVDNVPVIAALVHDTPTGGVVATDGSLDEAVVHKALANEGVPYFDFTPVAESNSQQMRNSANVSSRVTSPLLINREEYLRTRWNQIQGRFVDENRVRLSNKLIRL